MASSNMTKEERELIRIFSEKDKDYLTIHSKGSLGIDVTALRRDKRPALIEVKATKQKKFYFNLRTIQQMIDLLDKAKKVNASPYLAIKFKAYIDENGKRVFRGWNIFGLGCVPQLPMEYTKEAILNDWFVNRW